MKRAVATSISVLCATFLAFIAGASSARSETAQEIAKRAFGSTVLLVMEDAKGQPLSLGSGFFVRNGEIASNLHVVEGAARGFAKLVGQNTKHEIEGVTAIDAERDLVMLKVAASGLQALPLGSSDEVEVGESVYAVGNPHGLEGTFSQGIISSIRQIGTDKLLQITAPISPGSSGGPVLNAKGEVIGVSVATFKDGQNLNFAVPSAYLKALLERTESAKPLREVLPKINLRSIVADLGDKSSEGVVGGQVRFDVLGEYSFSLRNQLREDVTNVTFVVVFYDLQGNPIDVHDARTYTDIIPAGLAKRIRRPRVDESVRRLADPLIGGGRVEIRVLKYDLAKR